MQVYDVTSYIDDHPGGAESILLNAGVDCTDEFMGVHSQVVQLCCCVCLSLYISGLA
jgi:cytochrome b involved in lipid metabolism